MLSKSIFIRTKSLPKKIMLCKYTQAVTYISIAEIHRTTNSKAHDIVLHEKYIWMISYSKKITFNCNAH